MDTAHHSGETVEQSRIIDRGWHVKYTELRLPADDIYLILRRLYKDGELPEEMSQVVRNSLARYKVIRNSHDYDHRGRFRHEYQRSDFPDTH